MFANHFFIPFYGKDEMSKFFQDDVLYMLTKFMRKNLNI